MQHAADALCAVCGQWARFVSGGQTFCNLSHAVDAARASSAADAREISMQIEELDIGLGREGEPRLHTPTNDASKMDLDAVVTPAQFEIEYPKFELLAGTGSFGSAFILADKYNRRVIVKFMYFEDASEMEIKVHHLATEALLGVNSVTGTKRLAAPLLAIMPLYDYGKLQLLPEAILGPTLRQIRKTIEANNRSPYVWRIAVMRRAYAGTLKTYLNEHMLKQTNTKPQRTEAHSIYYPELMQAEGIVVEFVANALMCLHVMNTHFEFTHGDLHISNVFLAAVPVHVKKVHIRLDASRAFEMPPVSGMSFAVLGDLGFSHIRVHCGDSTLTWTAPRGKHYPHRVPGVDDKLNDYNPAWDVRRLALSLCKSEILSRAWGNLPALLLAMVHGSDEHSTWLQDRIGAVYGQAVSKKNANLVSALQGLAAFVAKHFDYMDARNKTRLAYIRTIDETAKTLFSLETPTHPTLSPTPARVLSTFAPWAGYISTRAADEPLAGNTLTLEPPVCQALDSAPPAALGSAPPAALDGPAAIEKRWRKYLGSGQVQGVTFANPGLQEQEAPSIRLGPLLPRLQ